MAKEEAARAVELEAEALERQIALLKLEEDATNKESDAAEGAPMPLLDVKGAMRAASKKASGAGFRSAYSRRNCNQAFTCP